MMYHMELCLHVSSEASDLVWNRVSSRPEASQNVPCDRGTGKIFETMAQPAVNRRHRDCTLVLTNAIHNVSVSNFTSSLKLSLTSKWLLESFKPPRLLLSPVMLVASRSVWGDLCWKRLDRRLLGGKMNFFFLPLLLSFLWLIPFCLSTLWHQHVTSLYRNICMGVSIVEDSREKCTVTHVHKPMVSHVGWAKLRHTELIGKHNWVARNNLLQLKTISQAGPF